MPDVFIVRRIFPVVIGLIVPFITVAEAQPHEGVTLLILSGAPPGFRIFTSRTMNFSVVSSTEIEDGINCISG